MKRLFRATLLVAALIGSAAEAALPPGLSARVDGEAFPQAGVEIMWRFSQLKQPQSTQARTLQAMIDNRVLANYGRRQLTPQELFPNTRVAFARDVALDDQTVGLLRVLYAKPLEQALAALPGGTIDGLLSQSQALTEQKLLPVFGDGSKLLLAYELNPAQQAAAKALPLLQYRLAGSDGVISLYDVYRRQNVQGRVEFHNRNHGFILQQAKLYLGCLFILDWAERTHGRETVQHLRRTLDDQDHVRAMQQYYGVASDMHYDSQHLKRLASAVSAAEVQRYYDTHKQQFRRIERVKARHIQLADVAMARRLYRQLQRGADFAALAKRHSLAADKAGGGDLGWLEHNANPSWLTQLAYALPPGKVSQPIRTPAGPNDAAPWEIVLVEQRIESYQAPDSDSVRYVAAEAIAYEQARSQFKALRANLLRNARIELDDSAGDK